MKHTSETTSKIISMSNKQLCIKTTFYNLLIKIINIKIHIFYKKFFKS
jgi:hypothetical protein